MHQEITVDHAEQPHYLRKPLDQRTQPAGPRLVKIIMMAGGQGVKNSENWYNETQRLLLQEPIIQLATTC